MAVDEVATIPKDAAAIISFSHAPENKWSSNSGCYISLCCAHVDKYTKMRCQIDEKFQDDLLYLLKC